MFMAITSWGHLQVQFNGPPSCVIVYLFWLPSPLWAKQTQSDWTTTRFQYLLPFNNQSVCYFEISHLWMKWMPTIAINHQSKYQSSHDRYGTSINPEDFLWKTNGWMNPLMGRIPRVPIPGTTGLLVDEGSFYHRIVQVIAHASQNSRGTTSTEHPRISHSACHIHSYYPLIAWTFTPSTTSSLRTWACSSPPTPCRHSRPTM